MTTPEHPTLYIFSGLPGAGKSTLAQRLASKRGCAYLRIDTIEQTIRDVFSLPVEAEGYQLAYRISADHLRLKISVVADSCNPVAATRTAWEHVARSTGASYANIEVCCSDTIEHRRRVETRPPTVNGLKPMSWPDVQNREYEAWERNRVVVDTSRRTIDESLKRAVPERL